jgi:hypothetical protein
MLLQVETEKNASYLSGLDLFLDRKAFPSCTKEKRTRRQHEVVRVFVNKRGHIVNL